MREETREERIVNIEHLMFGLRVLQGVSPSMKGDIFMIEVTQ